MLVALLAKLPLRKITVTKPCHVVALCLLGASTVVQAQTAQVHIAGSDYPVVFTDTNLSSKVRQRIASDLSIVFSAASSFDDAHEGEGTKVVAGVYRLDGLTALIITEKESEGIFLVDRDNEKSVRVDKVASSNYVHAFKLVDAHSNAIAKLSGFIAQVNDPGWLTKTAKERRAMFHASPWPPDEGEFSDDNILEFFADVITLFKCPGFSALHFVEEKRPEIGDAEVLVLYLSLVDRNPDPEERIPFFAFPTLYYKGKWGFGALSNIPTGGR
jgi:hypothetical protein